jgi:glycosyltransferase involved in cell wall biosynthesis
VIEDGKNGLLFPNRDSAGLCACLRRLMDNPGLLAGMAENAVKTFHERFTGRIFAENIERIYATTLKGDRDGKETK